MVVSSRVAIAGCSYIGEVELSIALTHLDASSLFELVGPTELIGSSAPAEIYPENPIKPRASSAIATFPAKSARTSLT